MLHQLLNQQINTYLGNNPTISPALASLFNCISDTYHQMDEKPAADRNHEAFANDISENTGVPASDSIGEIFKRMVACRNQLKGYLHSSTQDTENLHSLITDIQTGISALMAAEMESTGKLAETAAVNREMEQFAYIVSHELKSPLRAIANLSQWIEDDLTEMLNQDSKDQFRLLRNRVYRMESLINAILTYSKSTKQKTEMTQVDTNWLIREVIDSLDRPDHIEIRINGKFPVIESESVKLQQVFANLISNAIKYNDKKKGLVEISLFETEEYCQFSISDNGPGIEPQFHQKVFMIFQTLETRDEYESTGIGLAIVKKIIEDTGGKIWIESEKGKGTKFVFLWPKKRAVNSTKITDHVR